MRIAVTQPNFLPWLGYFDLLDQVDLWVSLDNVQLTRRSFVVRNRMKLLDGRTRWLSVSLERTPRGTNICEARLAKSSWAKEIANALYENYRRAPYARDYLDRLCDLLQPQSKDLNLARYNERLISGLCHMLDLPLAMRTASSLEPALIGKPQDKILALLRHFPTSCFYNFQTGVEAGLYDSGQLREQGIVLMKQEYRHPTYGQTADFVSHLSVVDLLLREGPRSMEVIRRGSRWTQS